MDRSSSEPTHTVIAYFQVQSACGTHFLLMSAAVQLQGSTVYHHTDVDAGRPCFYPLHRTAFIRWLFVLLFGITASASCTWTHHHGAILLYLRVGTSSPWEKKKKLENLKFGDPPPLKLRPYGGIEICVLLLLLLLLFKPSVHMIPMGFEKLLLLL